MKNIILLLFLFTATSLFAKVWRVNNNPGIAADFTTIQAAHDGADFGDTLLIEPSTNQYTGVTVTKKLILIGAGYFLDENYPDLVNVNDAYIVSGLTLSTGSNGSQIIGLHLQIVQFFNCSDILITRSRIGSIFHNTSSNISNLSITKNYIYSSLGITPNNAWSANNILISNNFISQCVVGSASNNNVEATLINNIFSGSIASGSKPVFFNNIAVNSSSFNFNGAFVANNIDAGGPTLARFGTENNNKGNVSATAAVLMVGAPGVSTDGQWKLRPASIAIGAGLNGVDCGMYGGDTPYVLSGLPPIPVITKFNGTITGDNTTPPIQVTVSVESKN
ncbi:MAG: hypothetical protein KF687_11055 [Cyclobacteriaceae bacterium]|nr:hypothetical protein [Cyclobacteriaceae bacterium]